MLSPDSTLHDRYRIVYAVDERPGSTLYRARDTQSGRMMLINALAMEGSDDLSLLARQVATVKDNILVPLSDHFRDGASYYMVCDDVGGQDLERTLRSRGAPLKESIALAQVQRLVDLLDTLHTQRPELYVGDLVPTDIWVDEREDWHLLPFTLVRSIGMTPSPYRAPELEGADAEPSPSSDLYALMALLYYTLTGWAPPTAAQRQGGTPLNGPRTLNPNLSTLIEQVLLRGLQVKKENRYQVPRELHLSLEMVQMMDGRSLGSGPDVTPSPTLEQTPRPLEAPTLGPPAAQPQPPAPPSIVPRPQPMPTQPSAYPPPQPQPGAYPSQPQQAPPGYAPYPQPYPQPQPEKRRGISTGCLVAIVVVLVLALVAVCGLFGWFLYSGSVPGAGLFGFSRLLATSAPTASTVAPATAESAETSATSAATEQPAAGSGALPTPAPANLDPGAITAANAAGLQQTREITGAVLGPVAYSPNGRFLAVGVGTAVDLQNADTLEDLDPPVHLDGHLGQVFALGWSPDSTHIATGAINDTVVRYWNVSTGKLERTFEGHTAWIRAIVWSPDGTRIATGDYNGGVRIWNAATGESLQTLENANTFISSLAFAPDGSTIAASTGDGHVRMWDVVTGSPRTGFTYESLPNLTTGAPLWTTGIAFTPDGKILAVGLENGSISLLDAATGDSIRSLTGHQGIVVSRGVVITPDGKTLVTASLDGSVRVWDIASGQEKATLGSHVLRVLSLALAPDGRHLASTSDQGGQLIVWDITQQEQPRRLRVGQGLITSMTYAPDNSVLGLVGYNGLLRLYLVSEKQSRLLIGSQQANRSLAFLKDGRVVTIADSGAPTIVDPRTASSTALSGLDGPVVNVAVSTDGNTIVANNATGAIGRWDSANAQVKPILQSTAMSRSNTLAVNDDGSRIAASGVGTAPLIEVWDGASGKVLHTLDSATTTITSLAFQPRGVVLAETDVSGALRLWNAENGTLLKTITATTEQGAFSALAFSPDGKTLVTGTPSGLIIFWNALTGEQVATLPPQADAVTAAAFSPDGRQLAVALADETVGIYEIAP